MEESFNILFTIRSFDTHESLYNHADVINVRCFKQNFLEGR
jgi:hypothetical protein